MLAVYVKSYSRAGICQLDRKKLPHGIRLEAGVSLIWDKEPFI